MHRQKQAAWRRLISGGHFTALQRLQIYRTLAAGYPIYRRGRTAELHCLIHETAVTLHRPYLASHVRMYTYVQFTIYQKRRTRFL